MRILPAHTEKTRQMVLRKLILTSLIALVALPHFLFAQAENVPATVPVYLFLKRMEVKGIIERYRDAVLPLSRREVAEFLKTVDQNRDKLTDAEKGWLRRYLTDFQYDATGSTAGMNSLISSSVDEMTSGFDRFFANTGKYLYAYRDTNLTFFVNGLLALDGRSIRGDALGSTRAEYLQGGGIIRGTIYNHLGYSMQATNALFWGSRELLARDPVIGQAKSLGTTDVQTFDIAEGHIRYDAGIFSGEVGMERVLWGTGYDQKMIMSDNVRPFPILRADFQYKAIKYTFVHGWLLGNPQPWTNFVSADSAQKIKGSYIADKYIAAHRLELSFPHILDFGFQEMVVYSNRSPDLAYVVPFMLLESAARQRGDRDNGLWSFDMRTHFTRGLELSGTFLFDDLHLSNPFNNNYYNKYAYQLGFLLTDPLLFHNTNLIVEWTRVNPFVFSHDYSIEDNYTSYGAPLGPRIAPNSESWFVRGDILPFGNLTLSLRFFSERHGDNIYDATGKLILNAGGDIQQGHRLTDPLTVEFLNGNMVKTQQIQFLATYEIVYQLWLDGWFQYDRSDSAASGVVTRNSTIGARVRLQF